MKTAFVFLTLLIISALSVEAGKRKKCRCKDNKAKIATLQEEMSDQKKKWTQQEEINAETAEKLSKEKVEIEALKTTVENLAALVNETCPCKQPPTSKASSCQELYEKDPSLQSKVYGLMVGSQNIPVYCHMGNFGCGDGGWTPAMKIDGKKPTFHYDASLWSNKDSLNLEGGESGFDEEETKLPTYWSTSFSKICLGMKIGEQINYIVINKQASSLHSLIADGQYRATSLGRDAWKSLIGAEGSLQTNCGKEGFNVLSGHSGFPKARIGILGNNEDNCDTCDSRIGFGTGGKHDDSNTCGIDALYRADNGDKKIKAMGYILVQ